MGQQVVTVTKAEEAATEEGACEAIVDEGFVPRAPLTSADSIAVWEEEGEYAKNQIVVETGHGYFRSQEAGNKEHVPHEDADFAHWAPVSETAILALQNPSFGFPATAMVGHARITPPASSAATASASETIGGESAVPLS